MAYSLDKLNKRGTDWEVDTNDFPFVKAKDLEIGEIYQVYGIYFHNKGNYGKSGVVIMETALVDLPTHMVPEMENMLEDADFVNDIKAGKIGFKPYSYDTKIRKNCIGFEFLNI